MFYDTMDTSSYNCKDSCTYIKDGEVNLFCFGEGSTPSKCLEPSEGEATSPPDEATTPPPDGATTPSEVAATSAAPPPPTTQPSESGTVSV